MSRKNSSAFGLVHVIASFITIFQFLVSIYFGIDINSNSYNINSITSKTETKVLLILLMVVVSSASYCVLTLRAVLKKYQVGLALSFILSLVGSWFLVIISKELFVSNDVAKTASFWSMVSGFALFSASLEMVGISVFIDFGEEDFSVTPFFWTIFVPFFVFMVVSIQ